MNFYIDIIDTKDNTHTTRLEFAERDSIVLNYSGSDAKDDLGVVGSSLDFNMEVLWNENVDGHFSHLFTGDETHFRTELRKESDDTLIWQGFILPDVYSEPFRSGTFYTNFTASDGLGRLKGKYLPDEFYEKENSVAKIIANCLLLTGLSMPVVIAPSIDNLVEKGWHKIYIDGRTFNKTNKKIDAHEILEMLTKDTISCLYQHLGKWYFEGLNKRGLAKYRAKEYSAFGSLISSTEIDKPIKNISSYLSPTPNVNIIAPYNEIEITHERQPLGFAETVSKENNDGWVRQAGVVEQVYSTEWYGWGGFFAKASAPDYFIYLPSNDNINLSLGQHISLLREVYVKQNAKLRFTAKFKIKYNGEQNDNEIAQHISSGRWTNNLRYQIQIGQDVIFTNQPSAATSDQRIQFNKDLEAELNLEFIPQKSGLLDVIFYQPFGEISKNDVLGIYIQEITLEEIAAEEEQVFTDTLNEEYTVDKEIELDYADDAAGLSKSFILAKINEENLTIYNVIDVPILDGFVQNGNNYSVVQLDGANLIADNIETVFYGAGLIPILDVIYNYQGGELMVIVTDALYDSGNFTVRQHKIKSHDQIRDHWEQWTDSIYEVERKRFAEAYMGVYRRMFSKPHFKIDCNVGAPILFGDLLTFKFQGDKQFSPLSLALNLDDGYCELRMAQTSYTFGDNGEGIPPYVDAGPDKFLINDQNRVDFDGTVYDPDGTIVSILWQLVSGPAGSAIISPNAEDTQVFGLTGDEYEFKLTATDNDGFTAFDTVKVVRQRQFTISFIELQNTDFTNGDLTYQTKQYEFDINPELPSDETLNITLNTLIRVLDENPGGNTHAIANVVITKNGNTLENYEERGRQTERTVNEQYVVSYRAGDVIRLFAKAEIDVDFVSHQLAEAKVTASTASFVDYPGTTSGLPFEILSFKEFNT